MEENKGKICVRKLINFCNKLTANKLNFQFILIMFYKFLNLLLAYIDTKVLDRDSRRLVTVKWGNKKIMK